MCQSENEKQDLEMIESAAVEISTYPFVQDVHIRQYKCANICITLSDEGFVNKDVTDKIYKLEYEILRLMKSNLNFDIEIQ